LTVEVETRSRLVQGLLDQQLWLGVWGCGHIGASAMYHFSQRGVQCIGYDITSRRVQEIQEGRFLATDTVTAKQGVELTARVQATTRWQDMKDRSVAVHIIAVPTERGAEPSAASLADVITLICDVIASSDLQGATPLVVIESTIQPSWIDSVVEPALQAHGLVPGRDVFVGAAPRRDWFSGSEHTLKTLPRILGGSTPECTAEMRELYALVCDHIVPAQDAHHAAFTKVIENLVRFQGLALANSLTLAFPDYDMTHVLALASTKWNIPLYHPSMGIGGHCIPLAPQYVMAEGGIDNPYLTPVLQAVEFNSNYFARLYHARLREWLQDRRSVAILGLAYTPDAKMHKLSPALDAVECLRETPRLRLHDPYYSADDVDDICGIATLRFPEDLQDCDAILLVTPHALYRESDVIEYLQPGTVIIDNFGAWRDKEFPPGVRYMEIGRQVMDDGSDYRFALEPSSTNTS